MSARRALARARVPDEPGARERAWAVVRSAYAERSPAPARRRSRWRPVLVLGVAALIGALVWSPAGATVRRLVVRALGIPHAAPALSSLPAPGTLLISGPRGTWTVSADGASRRLGPWPQASWSPNGLYVAVAGGDRLAAVDPHGVTRWTLERPAVRDPRWYSPTGYRIAYRSRGQLRVVAGDGTGDRLLAAGVAAVAPAWRPGHPYQLAYVDRVGRVVLRDGDSGGMLWSARAGNVRSLAWSADGSRLLALTPDGARVYDAAGGTVATIAGAGGAPAIDGALSGDGRLLALVRGGDDPGLAVARLTTRRPIARRVLAGAGVRQAVWSPDGRWLLVSWPAADQWVFVRVAGSPRIAAVSRIAQRFAAGRSVADFPRLDGWCCTAGAR